MHRAQMKVPRNSLAIINMVFLGFIAWIGWKVGTHLPGQLNPEMPNEVMLQKYQNVCSQLTASLTMMAFLAMVLINAVLIVPRFIMTTRVKPSGKTST